MKQSMTVGALAAALLALATIARAQPKSNPAPAKVPPPPAPATTNTLGVNAGPPPVTPGSVSNLHYDATGKGVAPNVAGAAPDATCWGSVAPYHLKTTGGTCLSTLTLTKVNLSISTNSIQIDGVVTQPTYIIGKNGPLNAVALEALKVADLAAQKPFVIVKPDSTIVEADDPKLVLNDQTNAPRNCTFPPIDDTERNPWDRHEARVDIDLTMGTVGHVPLNNVVRQNQGLLVRVCSAPGATVSFAWGGTRGLSQVATNTAGTNYVALVGEPTLPKSPVVTYQFPPRKPGSADLTVTSTDGAKISTVTLELEVDQLYWGAVRFGLGTLFDVGNRWRTPQIVTFAGARQQEVAISRNTVGFEIVNGFAPYLFDLIFCHGGRSETVGCNAHVAPYVGFGLVGASAQGIDALSSFHAGLELEFGGSFSIATNFVMRRQRALLTGYTQGSPVALGATVDDITKDSWQPGLALVINASPSFLQFATGTGSSTSSNSSTSSTDKKK